MFEVLVALMMSFLFLAGSLNAMVVSAIFQVKAERQAQAGYWIQEDLEQVRALAANFTSTTNCTTNTVATDFNTNGLSGLTNNPTRTFLGRTYTLTRTRTPSANVLQISYSVGTTTTPTETLATLYTEILPQAALNCP